MFNTRRRLIACESRLTQLEIQLASRLNSLEYNLREDISYKIPTGRLVDVLVSPHDLEPGYSYRKQPEVSSISVKDMLEVLLKYLHLKIEYVQKVPSNIKFPKCFGF